MSEITSGCEIEVTDQGAIESYAGRSARPFVFGTRWRAERVDPDGAVMVLGVWLPPGSVALAADVTAPETSIPHDVLPTIEALSPILPPNPKAAFGAQKPSLSLVPPVAMLHAAMAMENGAAKYGPYNWRERAVEARTYVDACKRHLDAWLDGQECSDDTSPPVHNLGHAIACLGILLDAQECGNLIDNRPRPGKSAEVQNRMKAAKIEAAK